MFSIFPPSYQFSGEFAQLIALSSQSYDFIFMANTCIIYSLYDDELAGQIEYASVQLVCQIGQVTPLPPPSATLPFSFKPGRPSLALREVVGPPERNVCIVYVRYQDHFYSISSLT